MWHRLRSGVGSSVSFSSPLFGQNSLLFLDVLARWRADSIFERGGYTFPNTVSEGTFAKFYEYFFIHPDWGWWGRCLRYCQEMLR